MIFIFSFVSYFFSINIVIYLPTSISKYFLKMIVLFLDNIKLYGFVAVYLKCSVSPLTGHFTCFYLLLHINMFSTQNNNFIFLTVAFNLFTVIVLSNSISLSSSVKVRGWFFQALT